MLRRTFITATTGTALTAATPPTAAAARYTIGATDAHRLRQQLDTLSAKEQAYGGSVALEQDAEAVRYQAIAMANSGSASARVRGMLYAVAAEAAAAACWYAIDGGRTESAERYLDRAMKLAMMSHDPYAVLHAWNCQFQLATYTGHRTDALAAAEAITCTSASRRDPLCASLGHARIGTVSALLGDRRRADAAFGHAEDALSHAETDAPRPRWLGFYGTADLHSLNAKALCVLGRPEQAEAHAHRALAATRPGFIRDKALYTVHLAEAQLAQGEQELAAATAAKASALAADVPGCARAHNAVEQLTNTLAAAR